MTDKPMNHRSASWTPGEMSVKTTRSSSAPTERAALREPDSPKCWQGCGATRASYAAGGMANCVAALGNWRFLIKWNIWLSNSSFRYLPQRHENRWTQNDLYKQARTGPIQNSRQLETVSPGPNNTTTNDLKPTMWRPPEENSERREIKLKPSRRNKMIQIRAEKERTTNSHNSTMNLKHIDWVSKYQIHLLWTAWSQQREALEMATLTIAIWREQFCSDFVVTESTRTEPERAFWVPESVLDLDGMRTTQTCTVVRIQCAVH